MVSFSLVCEGTAVTTAYPRRLIEVDLPIKRISAHARREKSIRHGHISTLHIWWARRPLAACRAVICAALWPDPADELCPPSFRVTAAQALADFAEQVRSDASLAELCKDSWARWRRTTPSNLRASDPACWPELRYALLDFIADFANWDASTVPAFLETARALTQAAHEALGGVPGTRPLVVDPFAGGGAIPLEALRVGADAFASDLNPVAVLLNKVVLEYIPKYGQSLIDQVQIWGEWIKEQAEKELAEFYPKDPDGAIPIAYLWARTITCEGPGCGTEVPLLRSLWLAKKRKHSVALRLKPDPDRKRIEIEILSDAKDTEVGRGTSAGGSATCPVCGFTTAVESVRTQLTNRKGGAHDARLIVVVTNRPREIGQFFRAPTQFDIAAVSKAKAELKCRIETHKDELSLIPDGQINHLRGFFNIVLYGITQWGDLFAPRQALTLSTFSRLVRELPIGDGQRDVKSGLAEAVRTCLALVVDRVAVRCTANCIWDATTSCIMQVFNQGQSLPARWEFAEMSPCIDSGSGWATSVEYTLKVLTHVSSITHTGNAELASATMHPLPNDSAHAIITDPPYYAAIPYADLSDFFYSWLKRSLLGSHQDLLKSQLTEKSRELVSLAHRAAMYREKDNRWFENQIGLACDEARRVCVPTGLGVFVFANKETEAWEAMLAGLINAAAALASSVHLVCRPRENTDGTLTENIGDWRDVLRELPGRIHEWMPRLAAEGVVGADAIFACLGPALEIFSRYSRVEKASGDQVKLGEYLEHVWAAVSREALSLLFKDADASGLEPDARLTAMWLWTLSTNDEGRTTKDQGNGDAGEEDSEDSEESEGKSGGKGGFSLEFDAARKIAQGLGANLDILRHVVEVKGETARLLPVGERTRYLFFQYSGTSRGAVSPSDQLYHEPRKKKGVQLNMFSDSEQARANSRWDDLDTPPPGATVLDRVHQAMILFAAGRAEAMKRFLVEEGAGNDARFWKLAQSLSALYPAGTDEKRWVDGVLARKKGLGF